MSCDRREFIKTTSVLTFAGAIGIIPNLITGCRKNGISPFTPYNINESTCIGCGVCLDSCTFDAINLPQKSIYSIYGLNQFKESPRLFKAPISNPIGEGVKRDSPPNMPI